MSTLEKMRDILIRIRDLRNCIEDMEKSPLSGHYEIRMQINLYKDCIKANQKDLSALRSEYLKANQFSLN